MQPLVMGVTGASGAVYALRLLEWLVTHEREVQLSMSPSGNAVLQQELGFSVDLDNFSAREFLHVGRRKLQEVVGPDHVTDGQGDEYLQYFHYKDFMAPMASGSALTGGMVVCPCSGGTLSAIAHGSSSNLIQRAADVHLKERRPLVLVPRETPLSAVHLDNWKSAWQAGAIVLPAMPGWYHGARSVGDLVDFIVARILDQLHVPHDLMQRWGEDGGTHDV